MEEEQKEEQQEQEEREQPEVTSEAEPEAKSEEKSAPAEEKKGTKSLRELWETNWFRMCVIVGGIFVLAIIIFTIVFSSGGGKKSNYYIGDELSNTKSTFSVDSCFETKSLSSICPVSNGYYIVVTVTIENKTDNTMRISANDFKLYCGSKKFSVSDNAVYYGGGALLIHEDLSAGLSKTMNLIFEASKSTDEELYVLSYSGKGGSYTVNLKEKPTSQSSPDDGGDVQYH